jgi:decaprenylphospho-beta-D-ribofuranose 2-oxidase
MKPTTLRDSGMHYSATPARIERPRNEDELRAVLADARRLGLRVSVMGAGKSQGGLILGDGIVISTDRLNRVIEVDVQRRTACVEPGVTWDMLREQLAVHGLAPCATQSYGVFTIGGSVAVNAHGRNVDVGVLAQTIESLRVMRADGEVVEASREVEAELFSLVIGGFGLFGIVTAVTLRLTRNDTYRRSCVAAMPSDEYPRYFAHRVAADPGMQFHYARFDVDDDRPWQRLFCVDYRRVDGDVLVADKAEDVAFQRFTLGCFRRFRWARRLRFLGDVAYRLRFDPARRSHVAKESWRAIERDSRRSADWLQEFFIPVGRFDLFVDLARAVFAAERWTPLNTTVRFVPKNTDAFLSYAREACFAFVLFFEQRHDARAVARTEAVLRRLLDAALDCGGAHHLCYQRIASGEQLRRAYPRIDAFFAAKRRHDPDELFHNQFYAQYGRRAATVRPLRLPPVERHAVHAADGTELLLQRFRGGNRGPVVCAAGYSMASSVFLLDTIATNLVEYLCKRGHDVWLFSWR